jgi:hypothetical protein
VGGILAAIAERVLAALSALLVYVPSSSESSLGPGLRNA